LSENGNPTPAPTTCLAPFPPPQHLEHQTARL
jgi:hypothetical protein